MMQKIINLKTPTNNKDSTTKEYVDTKINAISHTENIKSNIDLKELYNVVKSKQQTYTDLAANYNNLVSYDVKNIFLSRKDMLSMETGLDMNNNTIFNVKNPTEIDQGVNKGDVDDEAAKKLSLAGGTMTGTLDMGSETIIGVPDPKTPSEASSKQYVDRQLNIKIVSVVEDIMKTEEELKKYVNESHISSTSHLKDEFRYLMENADESSPGHDMTVNGITDFAGSPHLFNKKAYDLENIYKRFQ